MAQSFMPDLRQKPGFFLDKLLLYFAKNNLQNGLELVKKYSSCVHSGKSRIGFIESFWGNNRK